MYKHYSSTNIYQWEAHTDEGCMAVMRVLKVGSISIRLNKVTDFFKKRSTGSHQSTCTNSSIDRASAVVRDRSMIARSIDGCAIDR